MIFFACQVISAPAPAKPDTASRKTVTAVKQTVSNTDTSLLIEDLTEEHAAPAQSAAVKVSPAPHADSLGLLGQLAKTAPSSDSLRLNTKEMFRTMGNFHKVMGIYSVSAGVLAVIAGATILDKEDILPFSLSLVTLGGITVGIGVWEITIGRTLSR